MKSLFFGFVLLVSVLTVPAQNSRPVVIAHRGASGYLPEHTLEAGAFAHALGADFIEQDVIMSRDDVLVVCHDIHIDTTTNVAAAFPDRVRADGRYYAVDFTWAELRSLEVKERFEPATGHPVFSKRYPHNSSTFRLCSMEESILMVQGLNKATGREVGLYPEIKAPAWHHREGKDPGRSLLTLLARYGYTETSDKVFVQCFEPAELERLRFTFKTSLNLVQLLESGVSDGIDYNTMLTPEGLRKISVYAQGIGPHISQAIRGFDADWKPEITGLVGDAHTAGLLVHPYTFRSDALPRGFATIDQLLRLFIKELKVDGLFIDQPDAAIIFMRRHE